MSIIIGLTGQSGAGKTTVSKVFSENGFGVINCDDVARNCTSAGSECNKALAKVFPSCFDDKFSLDRKAISEIIFSNKQMLKSFDEIVYPFIIKRIKIIINKLSEKYDVILLDAPTLFESGADKLCDIKVAVIASHKNRLSRITKRDNISSELASKRLKSQFTEQFFKENCDYLIENNGTKIEARKDTLSIIKLIKERING